MVFNKFIDVIFYFLERKCLNNKLVYDNIYISREISLLIRILQYFKKGFEYEYD